MKPQKHLIDDFSYMIELEKPKTRIIKTEPRPRKDDVSSGTTKEYKKPLEINPVYRYTTDGELVDKYLNTKQMAKKLSWREYYINKAADEEKLFKGYFITRRSYTKEEIIERFKPKEKPIKQKIIKPIKEKKIRVPKEKKEKVPYIQYCIIYQYNEYGELVGVYNNCSDMANKTAWNSSTIKTYSKNERVFNGYLITRKQYTKDEAVKLYNEALLKQQMTYVYEDDKLIAICSSLSEVKELIGTDLTLRKLSYHKEKLIPIGNYILCKYRRIENT